MNVKSFYKANVDSGDKEWEELSSSQRSRWIDRWIQHDETSEPEIDMVNHPPHYTAYPVEVIELTEHLNFCRGNAVKYIARAGLKGGPEDEIQDLEKSIWYIQRELKRLEAKS